MHAAAVATAAGKSTLIFRVLNRINIRTHTLIHDIMENGIHEKKDMLKERI